MWGMPAPLEYTFVVPLRRRPRWRRVLRAWRLYRYMRATFGTPYGLALRHAYLLVRRW